jgi:hypothetical protein
MFPFSSPLTWPRFHKGPGPLFLNKNKPGLDGGSSSLRLPIDASQTGQEGDCEWKSNMGPVMAIHHGPT